MNVLLGCIATYDLRTPDPGPPEYSSLFGFHSYLSQESSAEANGWIPPQDPTYLGIDGGGQWEADRIQLAGGNAQRWILEWRFMQPKRETAPFAGSDKLVRPVGQARPQDGRVYVDDQRYLTLTGRGMTPIIAIDQPPEWAVPPNPGNNFRVPDMRFWNEIVRAVAHRYPLAVIEGPNEPNLTNPNDSGNYEIPPSAMAEMQRRMHDIVKAAHPSQVVIGPGLTIPYNPSDSVYGFEPYMRSLYERGLQAFWDGFTLHPYPTNSGAATTDLDSGSNNFRKLLDIAVLVKTTHADPDPLWVTETGVSTGDPRIASADVQRDLAAGMHQRMRDQYDVKAQIFHTLRDRPSHIYTEQEDPINFGYGWLLADQAAQQDLSATPKPVYCHFVALAGNTYPGCP